MPQRCTVCSHSERERIDKTLVTNSASLRDIAGQFRVSKSALDRHKAEHLPATMVKAQEVKDGTHALDVMEELRRLFARVNLLFDACDRWLRDPDDPTRYDIGPRAEDVTVTYSETINHKQVRKKAKLSALLAKVNGDGRSVEYAEIKHADPRELALKTAGQLQGQIELLAELLGELDERTQVNVLVASPEWLALRLAILRALEPYPQARLAVVEALKDVGC